MEKRLFVAIPMDPSPILDDFFCETKKRLKEERIKWVDSKNLHLTLKFLGKTQTSQLLPIMNRLSELCSQQKAFVLNLRGTGYLGSRNQPKVLIIRVEPPEPIKTVSEKMDDTLSVIGFAKEERPFKAHLTLGRIKDLRDRQGFDFFLAAHARTFFQAVRVEKIILYESILHSRGPDYDILRQFPLQG
jgi:RNA 2',3'-cyclic 3'-phosphodiesterase